jgi:carboxylesterase
MADLGWTVQGLMLPGMGRDISTLHQRCLSDWTGAVAAALARLTEEFIATLVVGYSMGGALAIDAAAKHQINGLILLAPFWSLGEPWLNFVWPLIRLVFRQLKPLNQVDFSKAEIRNSISRMFGEIDIDDPSVRQALRDISVPLKTIEQVRKLGTLVFRQAAHVEIPTIVLQGLEDRIAPPHRTKQLIRRLTNVVEYREIKAGHDLIDSDGAAWVEVKDRVVNFVLSSLST